MVGRSCFFVGHRETPPELLPVLTYAIEQHISKYGVTEFIVGDTDRLTVSLLTLSFMRSSNIRKSFCFV